MAKQRVDSLLVTRGLCDSREQAKRLIMAGEVMTGTERISKPSQKVMEDADLDRGLDVIEAAVRAATRG